MKYKCSNRSRSPHSSSRQKSAGKTVQKDNDESRLGSFLKQFGRVTALSQLSKRVIDPDVMLLNTTQKEMVELIIRKHEGNESQQAEQLTKRAKKYLRVLWTAQKTSNSKYTPVKKQEISKSVGKKKEQLQKRSLRSISKGQIATPRTSLHKKQVKNIHKSHKQIDKTGASKQASIGKQSRSKSKKRVSFKPNLISGQQNQRQDRTPPKKQPQTVKQPTAKTPNNFQISKQPKQSQQQLSQSIHNTQTCAILTMQKTRAFDSMLSRLSGRK